MHSTDRGDGRGGRGMAPLTDTIAERALIFECAGDRLVGIVAEPTAGAGVGVLIVVGGPQYRVGSHRQFLLLARQLAKEGFATMRFDCRGMGDSTGSMRSFEDTEPDIAAAIDAFEVACPSVRRIVLWGLCDAASAALLYWNATRDTRIGGMVLLNPWVRSEASLARTHIKHYYGKRLFEKAFWAKLLQGGVDIAGTMRNLAHGVRASMASRGDTRAAQLASFQDRMADAVRGFAGPILVILSGRDLTAKEFREYASTDPRWRDLLDRPTVERREVPEADHTFSSAEWRAMAATTTRDWLEKSVPSDL